MGSATIRRFASVAALLLLAPISCRASLVLRATERVGVHVIGPTSGGGSTVPAIRRHASAVWGMAASRADHARGPVAVGMIALLSVLVLVRWAPLAVRRSAPSSLARRRYDIALRAPPLLVA